MEGGMKLKTYRAASIADALGEIKADLGADAVILHTRTFKAGGVFGLGSRKVFEITATTPEAVSPPRRRPAPARATLRANEQPVEPRSAGAALLERAYSSGLLSGEGAEAARGAIGRGPSGGIGGIEPRAREVRDEVRLASGLAGGGAGYGVPGGVATAYAPASGRVEVAGGTVAAPPPGPAPASLTVSTPPTTEDVKIASEIASLKRLVGQVLTRTGGSGGAPAMPDALFALYSRLLESQLADELADEIAGEVRRELSDEAFKDEEAVRAAVARRLEAMIPAAESATPPRRAPDGRPLTIALVGPTGVGKTTTIAKLAATYKLRHGKSVGLITSDTYRIAAVDQLRTYANIIGLPLEVAMTPGEMKGACARLSQRDVILIDTAGRSPSDGARLEELKKYIEAASPHETHLVLSSVTSESSMVSAAERFGAAGPDRVIFTKLDEAAGFGVLVNASRKIGMKLSYLTTGQEVPDHLEPGRASRLAALVLDGEVEP